jgi:DNA repair protein RadC
METARKTDYPNIDSKSFGHGKKRAHGLSVLDLCDKVMWSVTNDPARLLTRTAEDFCKFRGIGVAKAATLLAAFELGRRAFSVH